MGAAAAPLALALALVFALTAPARAGPVPGAAPVFASSFGRTGRESVAQLQATSLRRSKASTRTLDEPASLNPLFWWTTYFSPLAPEVGGKLTFTMRIVNVIDKPIAKGTVVSFWANKTEVATCGEAGADAEYTLPEIAPFETLSLDVKLPFSGALQPGNTAFTRIFVDSTCSVYNISDTDNQEEITFTMVEKGLQYAYLVAAVPPPDLYPFGAYYANIYELTPRTPVAGSSFSASFVVQNLGTIASPTGVVARVYPEDPELEFDACNNPGGVVVELPKIGPGKSKTVTADGLTAPLITEEYMTSNIVVVVDDGCTLGTIPISVGFATYDIMPSPSAWFLGEQAKEQLTFSIKIRPKAPKASDTMTVKIKFLNWGSVEGALGTVGLWLQPAGAQQSPLEGGIVLGAPCDYNTFAATADFSGVVVKPGKSKTVKIKDVPVPEAAGWWQVSAIADAGCALPASSSVFPAAGYAAFEVVAA